MSIIKIRAREHARRSSWRIRPESNNDNSSWGKTVGDNPWAKERGNLPVPLLRQRASSVSFPPCSFKRSLLGGHWSWEKPLCGCPLRAWRRSSSGVSGSPGIGQPLADGAPRHAGCPRRRQLRPGSLSRTHVLLGCHRSELSPLVSAAPLHIRRAEGRGNDGVIQVHVQASHFKRSRQSP